MRLLTHLIDAARGKHPLSAKRSDRWPTVRKQHLLAHPTCELCGGHEDLEVHHKQCFHLHPELELDPTNLITLCEAKKNGVNCHLFLGHLGNFKSVNVTVAVDAKLWRIRIVNRP